MKNLISKISGNNSLKIGLVGLLLSGFLMGCAAPAQNTQNNKKQNKELTEAQKKVIAGEVLARTSKNPYLALGGILLSTTGQMEHDLDIANEGKDNINIYQNQAPQQSPPLPPNGDPNVLWLGKNAYIPKEGFGWRDNQGREPRYFVEESNSYVTGEEWRNLQKRKQEIINYNNLLEKRRVALERKEAEEKNQKFAAPKGFFTYNKWVDLNADNLASEFEFFGLGKTKFDLDKELLEVAFNVEESYSDSIILRSWTTEGELVGTTKFYLPKNKLFIKRTGLDSHPTENKDYLDLMREHGPGKYILTANTPNGKTYKIDLEFTD